MFYIVVRKNLRPRSEWSPQIMSDHLAWAAEEDRHGRLLVSGPTGDGGIYLLKAADHAEAEAIARRDSAINSGCCSFELHEWDIKRGRELFG